MACTVRSYLTGGRGGEAAVADDSEEEGGLVVGVHGCVVRTYTHNDVTWLGEPIESIAHTHRAPTQTPNQQRTVHGQPLIRVLRAGAGHRRARDARRERRLAVAVQGHALGALWV